MRLNKIIWLFLYVIIVVSCSSTKTVQRKNQTLIGTYTAKMSGFDISYEIRPDGVFTLSYDGILPGLVKYCNEQQGIWTLKKDTLIMNTFFQNRVEDYMYLNGNRSDDSIEIIMFSLSNGSLSDEGICIYDYGFYYPDSNGRIIISCSQKKQFVTFVKSFSTLEDIITENNIECGKKYLYFFKDCQPTLYKNKKFVIRGSSIFDFENNIFFNKLH